MLRRPYLKVNIVKNGSKNPGRLIVSPKFHSEFEPQLSFQSLKNDRDVAKHFSREPFRNFDNTHKSPFSDNFLDLSAEKKGKLRR